MRNILLRVDQSLSKNKEFCHHQVCSFKKNVNCRLISYQLFIHTKNVCTKLCDELNKARVCQKFMTRVTNNIHHKVLAMSEKEDYYTLYYKM